MAAVRPRSGRASGPRGRRPHRGGLGSPRAAAARRAGRHRRGRTQGPGGRWTVRRARSDVARQGDSRRAAPARAGGPAGGGAADVRAAGPGARRGGGLGEHGAERRPVRGRGHVRQRAGPVRPEHPSRRAGPVGRVAVPEPGPRDPMRGWPDYGADHPRAVPQARQRGRHVARRARCVRADEVGLTLDLRALQVDVASFAGIARKRPLTIWRGWGDHDLDGTPVVQGARTTQRRLVQELQSCRNVIALGGQRSGKTEVLRAAGVALGLGSDHPDALAFWLANGCDPDAFPRGPGNRLRGGAGWFVARTSGDSIRYSRPQVLALIPKWGPTHEKAERGESWRALNLDGRGEARIEV